MPARTIEIKVDIISDPSGSAKMKRAVNDIEKEVVASQKRVQSASKATDRAIAESQKQVVNAAKIGAKSQADKVIQELKRTESAAKKSADSIQSSLKNAFSGGMLGGAIGGFAGSIVGQFTAGIAQLPTIFKNQLDEMVRIASERQNAFKGLESMSKFLGINSSDTQDAVKNLRLVKAGVVDIGDATIGLKNLLSSGFSLPEATKLLEAFSDTAAFGKSNALSFGEAIRGATEGIRNGNSVLVDNVGLTKNLSAILKDAGFAEQDLAKAKDDVNVRQALYNGLLKEALPQMGDANKLTQGWTGNTAALTTAQNNLYAALGNVIIKNAELNALIQTTTGDLRDLTTQMEDTESGWSRSIDNMTSSFSRFVSTLVLDVQRGIANLKDLMNDLEWMYYRSASLATDLGTGITTAGAERKRLADEAGARRNQNTLEFDNRTSPQYRARYSANVSAQRQAMSGGQNIFSSQQRGLAMTGIPNNVAFPGMLGGNPGTYAGGGPMPKGRASGGGARTLPKTKSSRVNLNLKDEMSDALEITAKYGLTVTSGKDGKHNAGSTHLAGGAFDIRSIGVHPAYIETAMRELQAAGYYVKDERSRPPGQKVWSNPHVHVGGRQTPKNRTASPTAMARVLNEWTPTDIFGREITTGGGIDTDIQGRGSQVDANEKLIQRNEDLIQIYDQLDDQIFNLVDRTEEEIMVRKISLGFIKDLTEEEKALLILRSKAIDDAKREADKKREQEDFDKRVISEMENIKREEYQKTRDMIEESLDYLSRGDFKGLAKSFMERQRRAFVEKGTDFILEKLGIENPNDTPELKEAKRQTQLLKQIAVGVGMPGTTGAGATISSTLGGLFGGGPLGLGGNVTNSPYGDPSRFTGLGNTPQMGLGPGGGGRGGGGILSGLTGAGGMFGPIKNILTSKMSSMGGIMGGIGSVASMAGGMIGGRWGNLVSMAGTGASMGASFGPWGAAIGAAIGGGIGLISALLGRDNANKKLKEAALSTYGITVKDKSVLNSLKQLGETMFGKGKVGANAGAVVSSDQGQNILRNYAEATGQSTKMMDRLYYGDENWEGNQFRGQFNGFSSTPGTKFGGFRAMGGPVTRGFSYIVGERGPEMFTPRGSGAISPTVGTGDAQMKVILGTLEESINMLATRLNAMSAGQVLAWGAAENPNIIGDIAGEQLATRQDLNDQVARGSGRAW